MAAIRLELTKILKKATPLKNKILYILQEISHEYAHSAYCFTDGSKFLDETSFAYPIDSDTTASWLQNTFSMSSAELSPNFFSTVLHTRKYLVILRD